MTARKMRRCSSKEKCLEDYGCHYVEASLYNGESGTYTFDDTRFALSSIDDYKSKKYFQNRNELKVDPDVVSGYALAMAPRDDEDEGCMFPALLVCQDPQSNLWLTIDGNHTKGALEKNNYDACLGIYKFSLPEPMVIGRVINRYTTGHSESADEVLDKAVQAYLVKEAECLAGGLNPPTQKSWAEQFFISKDKFNRHYKLADTRRKLTREGIAVNKLDAYGKPYLDDTSIERIGQLYDRDVSVAKDIAKMSIKFNLKAGDIKKFSDEFTDASKNNVEKQHYFEQYKDRLIKSTSNGKLIPKSRPRRASKESIWKEGITKLDNLSQKVDEKVLKILMKDKVMADATLRVYKLLKNILDK